MKVASAPKIDIKIRQGNQDLEEIDIPDHVDTPNTAAKYIEVSPGANFSVHFLASRDAAPSPLYQVEMSLSIDGEAAGARMFTLHEDSFRPSCHRVSGMFHGRYESHAHGASFYRFMFTDLHTHEHGADPVTLRRLTDELACLGEITVNCHWVIVTGSDYKTQTTGRAMSLQRDNITVPEKALKGRAVSAKATLGAAEPAEKPRYYERRFPTGREPFARYVFKYRSRNDLQAEGVIPRNPSPIRLEDRDIDTLSLEEARQLLARQIEQKHSQLMVKRERDEKNVASADGEGIEIITQRPTKRKRRCPDPAAEVVDLTELLD